MATVNLERGFRRITAILSLAIFIPGVLFALTWWFGERRAWTDALKQPDTESLVVRVVGKGDYVFGKRTTETEIVKGIEKLLVASTAGGETSRKGYTVVEILGHATTEKDDPSKLTPADEPYDPSKFVPVDEPYAPPVSYVYRPTTPDRPGHLYSVKELLEGRASGTLPEDVKETIDKLGAEKPSRLPWESWTTKPVVFGVPGLAGALGLATGLAAVPWAVFFLLRWVFRGFAPDTAERP